MLASITPLGERGRNSRWVTTVVAYITGSTVAAGLLGGLLGVTGSVALASRVTPRTALAVLAILTLLGLAFDSRAAGLRLPTVHRQVDDAWMYRYRSWFYGAGFGAQLGIGVITIVNSSMTYVVLAAELLTVSPSRGALIGAVFGLARSVVILPGRRIQNPEQLSAFHRHLAAWNSNSRLAAYATQGALGIISAVAAVR
jgi:uncharacterized membrane protein YagU involved in acid resistance